MPADRMGTLCAQEYGKLHGVLDVKTKVRPLPMNAIATRCLVAVSGAALLSVGLYGTVHRAHANLANELQAYGVMSLFFMWPFVVLGRYAKNNQRGNLFIAVVCCSLACVGGRLFFGDMVLSHDSTWGFSVAVVSILNTIAFVPAFLVVRLLRRSNA